MTTLLRTRIIRIGNSQGIRIPRTLLDLARLSRDVEVEANAEQIVIRSVRGTRQDWDDQFQRMAAQGDDVLLDAFSSSLSAWDDEEWEWQ
jgi:antitoxin MazE